jgi:DNA uptake protein ComE-like DNA-binding protein
LEIKEDFMSRSLSAPWLGLALLLAVVLLPGCSRQDNAKIQHDSAKAAQEARQDTQQLAANTKQALTSAENTVDAAANGVKQGIKAHIGPADASPSDGKTPAGKIDLNSASHNQIAALPGISDAKADAIIAGRPYDTPRSVVAKGILTPAQFHRIALEVAVQ